MGRDVTGKKTMHIIYFSYLRVGRCCRTLSFLRLCVWGRHFVWNVLWTSCALLTVHCASINTFIKNFLTINFHILPWMQPLLISQSVSFYLKIVFLEVEVWAMGASMPLLSNGPCVCFFLLLPVNRWRFDAGKEAALTCTLNTLCPVMIKPDLHIL